MPNEITGHIPDPVEIRVELIGSGPPGPVGPPGETPFIGDNGNWWVGDQDLGIPATAEGSFRHDRMENRALPDQHPIEAITGLREVVDGLPLAMTADELRKILLK